MKKSRTKQVTTTARVVLVVCVYMRRKTLYQKATTLSYTDNKRISSARGAAVAPTTTMTAQTTTFCTRDHSLKITRIKTVTLVSSHRTPSFFLLLPVFGYSGSTSWDRCMIRTGFFSSQHQLDQKNVCFF